MKKTFYSLLIAAVLSVSLLFTGCSEIVAVLLEDDSECYSDVCGENVDSCGNGCEDCDSYENEDNYGYGGESQTVGSYRPQGSVNLIAGKTIMVTVFVSDESNEWTDEEEGYVAYAQKNAADFIMTQAKNCGKTSEIITWSEENADLAYILEIDGAYKSSRNETNSEYPALMYEQLETLPIEELEQKYGTDSIGFLVILDTPGNSYAFPYCAYDNGYGYNEFVTMYMYDEGSDMGEYESVPAYTHEIMHLFGAVDLYKVGDDDGVNEDVYNYASEYLYNELMYTTYEEDGSISMEGISQYLSDITLAMTGLIAGTEVTAQFPSLKREYVASFGALAASE